MLRPVGTLPAAAALLVSLAAAPALAADPSAAQALFDRGIAAMDKGNYDEACPAIEQSYKLDPLPGALYALADCERKRGHPAAAATRYDEYVAVYATLPAARKVKQGTREKDAREARAALAPKIAELTLALPANTPKGTVVLRNGAPVDDKALGVPVLLEPGEHVVSTQAPGGPVTETRVTLAAGEKRGVALEVRLPDAPAAALAVSGESPAPAPQPGGPIRMVVIAGGAVAGAGVVVGAALLGVGLGKSTGSLYTAAKAAEPSSLCPSPSANNLPAACASLKSALESRSTLGSAGVWTLVGGGVIGIATGIYALAGGGRARPSGLVVSPMVGRDGGGIAVRGSF